MSKDSVRTPINFNQWFNQVMQVPPKSGYRTQWNSSFYSVAGDPYICIPTVIY